MSPLPLSARALSCLAAALAPACIVVLPDAEPALLARKGALAASVEEPPRLAGAWIDQDVRLESASGLTVELALRSPAVAGPAPRPAILLIGGHRTGRDAARLVPDTRGTVVAALSYPTRLRRVESFGDALELQRAIVATPAAILLALDYLAARPDVDPRRIELVGVSLGAPFACVAGALDPRPRRVWAIHGGGSPQRLLAHALREEIGWKPLREWTGEALAVLSLAVLVAPEDWVGRISPRPFVMVNASADERIPQECVELLYAAAREPKELVWLPGGHVAPGEAEQLRALCDLVLDRVVAGPEGHGVGAR